MTSLLPELISAIRLVPGLQEMQQFEQGPRTVGFQKIDETPGSERLEITDLLGQILGRRNQVQMILQNDVAVENQAPLVVEKLPGIIEDLHGVRPREYREPADDGAGEEVGVVVFVGAITAACHRCLPRRRA